MALVAEDLLDVGCRVGHLRAGAGALALLTRAGVCVGADAFARRDEAAIGEVMRVVGEPELAALRVQTVLRTARPDEEVAAELAARGVVVAAVDAHVRSILREDDALLPVFRGALVTLAARPLAAPLAGDVVSRRAFAAIVAERP